MKHLQTQAGHKAWLRITAIVIASFGPVFFLGSMPATAWPAAFTLDFLGWPLDGLQHYDSLSTRFLSALTGGFLMGWGVCVWLLRRWVYDAAPEGTRKAVLAGIITWFLFDSAGSAASGHPSNVFFNTLVLIIAVGPMWRPARAAETKPS
ncbi:MAG: hypothetical protein MUF62_13960 [Chitinophagaceae bacterium]|jgi:hypothetical protein|nr:hypothetical protein [Chitinophagaceae bacterium]